MALIDRSIQRVCQFARDNNLSKSQLASLAKMNDTTLRNLGKESWNPTSETLRKLEAIIPQDYTCSFSDNKLSEAA